MIDYSSGWRNRAPVAARRAVLTGVSQLSAQINEQVAKDLKTDKYEVSWHSGHRPSHWWGGRVYTYQELQSVCGLGEGDGLCGWNCRHSYYAFLEGFSARTYTDEQLAVMEEKEQNVRTYQGKQYNAYQASQHSARWKLRCGHSVRRSDSCSRAMGAMMISWLQRQIPQYAASVSGIFQENGTSGADGTRVYGWSGKSDH